MLGQHSEVEVPATAAHEFDDPATVAPEVVLRGADIDVLFRDALVLAGSDGVYAEADAPLPPRPWWHDVVEEPKPTYIHAKGTSNVVGRLQQLNTRSLKATCKVPSHGSCVCWVSLKPDRAEAGHSGTDMNRLRDQLMEWLARGASSSEDQHFAAARDLKIAAGMKVR